MTKHFTYSDKTFAEANAPAAAGGLDIDTVEGRRAANTPSARHGHAAIAHDLLNVSAWMPPEDLPRREWLYGRHLLRGRLSVLVAPGGIGKTSLLIAEALAMVTGRQLLCDQGEAPLRVLIINLEDAKDEMDRRIAAAMAHFGITSEDIGGRLHLASAGADFRLASQTTSAGLTLNEKAFDALRQQILSRQIDVITIDPFISCHQISENDNVGIDFLAKELARLAAECNCAIEVVHHTRKLNGDRVTSESMRGASALLNAARVSRVLNPLSEKVKKENGIEASASYFEVATDKANLSRISAAKVHRIVSVDLQNGDSVGVCESSPSLKKADKVVEGIDNITPAQRAAILTEIAAKEPCRYHPSATAWVGFIIARVMHLDPEADGAKIANTIEIWIKDGTLIKSQIKFKQNPSPVVKVNPKALEACLPG
ncbi:AAA family ATPase [Cereibacter sp. SYSU M97828]|nr:AAA family ATPase [Cereibacter flavus]